jgi:CelD/BcsL family acetyltransferase involved in cellulose biosynthesis
MEGRVIPAEKLSCAEIAAWDKLCRQYSSLANPFLSPHYTRAMASVRGDIFVCVLMESGEPLGFLPFQFRTGLHRLLRAAEPAGQEMTDRFGLIAAPGFRIGSHELLRLAKLHVLNFRDLDETQLGHGLTGESPERAYLMRLDREESYWKALRRAHNEFAVNTERRERQAERQLGPLRFTPMETDWRVPLQNLIQHKERQYRETGKPNLFAVPWRRRLLEKLAECREPTCTGVLSTLYAGETWLASHFGLRSCRVLHYCFPVYNPEVGRFGPGRLLLKALIEKAQEMQIELVDHGAGEARYKQECSNDFHMCYRGVWHLSSVRSLFGRAAESLRWRLERLTELRGAQE